MNKEIEDNQGMFEKEVERRMTMMSTRPGEGPQRPYPTQDQSSVLNQSKVNGDGLGLGIPNNELQNFSRIHHNNKEGVFGSNANDDLEFRSRMDSMMGLSNHRQTFTQFRRETVQ